ncbi:MAG: amino acid permease [Pirellulaceae bacterium]
MSDTDSHKPQTSRDAEPHEVFNAMPNVPPRKFGFWVAHFLVVACMVGAGILTTSGYTLLATGNPAALLALWAVGGLLALCGVLTISELATTLPKAGSDYVFVREAFGRDAGAVAGWATFILGFAAPTAVGARATAAYITQPLVNLSGDTFTREMATNSQPIIATLLVLGIMVIHTLGHRESAWFQVSATLLKIAVLVGLVVFGLTIGSGSWSHWDASHLPPRTQWPALAIGLLYVSYAYSGWNGAAYVAGEVQEPERLLPRAMISGCLAVTALYLLVNVVYVYALDPTRMGEHEDVERVAVLASASLFGPTAANVIASLLGFGLIASVSAYMLAGPRIVYAMAEDRAFPKIVGGLHPTRLTPMRAIVLQGLVAIIVIWSGTFREILDFTSVGLAAVSGLVIASIFPIRRRADLPKAYRMPLYPLPPLIFLLVVAGTIGINLVSEDTRLATILSLVTLLAGVPIAWWLVPKSKVSSQDE